MTSSHPNTSTELQKRARVGDYVVVTSEVVIDQANYTGQTGKVIRERFHAPGFVLLIRFSKPELPDDWFHPDEITITSNSASSRRNNRLEH